jgi:hypothetical protein
MTEKRVPLIDRTGKEPKQIGWATVDENGIIVGELEFDDPNFSGTGSFSLKGMSHQTEDILMDIIEPDEPMLLPYNMDAEKSFIDKEK